MGSSFLGAPEACGRTQRVAMNLKELQGGEGLRHVDEAKESDGCRRFGAKMLLGFTCALPHAANSFQATFAVQARE